MSIDDFSNLESEPIATFDEKWMIPFEGLLYLGYLEKTVKIPRHEFVLRTAYPGELIEASLIVRDLEQSLAGFGRAWKAAKVAASIDLVDGRRLVPTEKNTGIVRQKYEYLINTFFDPVIDVLYNATRELDLEQSEVLLEMQVIDQLPGDLVPLAQARDARLGIVREVGVDPKVWQALEKQQQSVEPEDTK